MKLYRALIASLTIVLISGCASNYSYPPEYDKGFEYNNDESFAMNVLNGSLGFHYGVRDAKTYNNSSTTATDLDYAVSGMLGLMTGGLGGAFLMMSADTSLADAPLNITYGIAYIPVSDKTEASIIEARNIINNDLIRASETAYDVTYSHSVQDGNTYAQIYSGEWGAKLYKNIMPRSLKRVTEEYKLTSDDQFVISAYDGIKLYRYSTVNPHGQQGLFAVIGIHRLGVWTSLKTLMELDQNQYYVFSPSSARNSVPFLLHKNKAWLFTTPTTDLPKGAFINKSELMQTFPKLKQLL